MMNVKQLIMPIIQLENRRRKNKAIVLFVCGIVLFNTILGGCYLLLAPKPQPVFTPASTTGVHVSAPNVVATIGALNTGARGHALPTYTAARPSYTAAPNYSGGSGWRVVQTSDQRVQSYGGGGGVAGGVSSGGHSSAKQSPSNGGSVSVAIPVTSFVSLGSSRMIADAGAQEAPQMAEMAAAPIHRAPGPPNTGSDPLPGDQQLVEHTPLPDGTIALALMVLISAFSRFFVEKWRKMRA